MEEASKPIPLLLMGQELSGLGFNQLMHLENQLQISLENVRVRKVSWFKVKANQSSSLHDQTFRDEIKELQQKGSLIHQQNKELHKKIDLIHKENAELQKVIVIEARGREEEKATLNPSQAIRNGYDILDPVSLQQSQPQFQPQHSEPPAEVMILGSSLKLMI
ncbi:MADS-box transcription factor 27, partial [Mucuna pruriens]